MDPRLPSLVALNGRITPSLSSFILPRRLREVMLATPGPSRTSRLGVWSIRRPCSETPPLLRPRGAIAGARTRKLNRPVRISLHGALPHTPPPPDTGARPSTARPLRQRRNARPVPYRLSTVFLACPWIGVIQRYLLTAPCRRAPTV